MVTKYIINIYNLEFFHLMCLVYLNHLKLYEIIYILLFYSYNRNDHVCIQDYDYK